MRSPNDSISTIRNGAVGIEHPITVTIPIARQISGLGNTTLWKLVGNGTLKTVQVGRRRLIVYESLRRLLTPTDEAVSVGAPRRRGRPHKSGKVGAP